MPDYVPKRKGSKVQKPLPGQRPRQSWKEGQNWQAEGRMDLGQGVPHGAGTCDLAHLRPSQSQYLRSGLRSLWGRRRIPKGPAPGLPLPGVNKRTHSRGHLSQPCPAPGGEDRTASPALRLGSYTQPVPAVQAGLAANDPDMGINMCPAAPQAAWPDLPSNPCPTQSG